MIENFLWFTMGIFTMFLINVIFVMYLVTKKQKTIESTALRINEIMMSAIQAEMNKKKDLN